MKICYNLVAVVLAVAYDPFSTKNSFQFSISEWTNSFVLITAGTAERILNWEGGAQKRAPEAPTFTAGIPPPQKNLKS